MDIYICTLVVVFVLGYIGAELSCITNELRDIKDVLRKEDQ